jgi:hypothetical protein
MTDVIPQRLAMPSRLILESMAILLGLLAPLPLCPVLLPAEPSSRADKDRDD